MARSINVDDAAKALFQLAEEAMPYAPTIENFNVTDGLKAQAVGLVRGTAERLHGRSMAGITNTMVRVGKSLGEINGLICQIGPVYETLKNDDGSYRLVYEPHPVITASGKQEFVMRRRRASIDAFGYNNRTVYSTYLQTETDAPDYRHGVMFTNDFTAKAMFAYTASPHCRADDFAFHMEILRGQLVLWGVAPNMVEPSVDYTLELLNMASNTSVNAMLESYEQDLIKAGAREIVTV
jgi:hypothetical protein